MQHSVHDQGAEDPPVAISAHRSPSPHQEKNARMKRIAREPEKFEVLDLFTTLGRTRGFKIGEPASIDDFSKVMKESIQVALENRTILHGKRVEAMFAHVVGSLGACRLIKTEDAGEIFVDGEDIRAPDYRLILRTGKTWLVEVKNCHIDSPKKSFVVKQRYFSQLERYAELNNAELKIAVYFSRLNRWCLLSKRALRERGDRFECTLISAMAKSEMAELGDCTLATLPDLRLELTTGPDEAAHIDGDGNARFTVRKARLLCAGNELTSPLERKIAFYFMRYGDWGEDDESIIIDGKLQGVVYISQPAEAIEGQPFSMLGNFSSMASTAYSEFTVADRVPVALDAPVDPSDFSLVIPEDYNSATLPLWRFIVQPNWDFVDPAQK